MDKYEVIKSFIDKYTDTYYEYNPSKKLVVEINDKLRAKELIDGGLIKEVETKDIKNTKQVTKQKTLKE